jgi:hypothetical protein
VPNKHIIKRKRTSENEIPLAIYYMFKGLSFPILQVMKDMNCACIRAVTLFTERWKSVWIMRRTDTSPAPMIQAVRSSETSISYYIATRCHNPVDISFDYFMQNLSEHWNIHEHELTPIDQSPRWKLTVAHAQAWRPPIVGCPQMLIPYIRSYPPYLEVISSTRNPRTRHAVVTRVQLI